MEFVRCVRSPDFGNIILSRALQYFNILKPAEGLRKKSNELLHCPV